MQDGSAPGVRPPHGPPRSYLRTEQIRPPTRDVRLSRRGDVCRSTGCSRSPDQIQEVALIVLCPLENRVPSGIGLRNLVVIFTALPELLGYRRQAPEGQEVD